MSSASDNRRRCAVGATQADVSHSSRFTSKPGPRQKSLAFEKLVPASLIVLGIVMVVLILFAVGVLLGLIRF